MEESVKKPAFALKSLFTLLGAACAVVVGLGTFGAIDNRGPASIDPPAQETDFNPAEFYFR